MLIIRNLKLPLDFDFDSLPGSLAKHLKIDPKLLLDASLHRRSVDARDKSNVYFNCAFTLSSKNESTLAKALKRCRPEAYTEVSYRFERAESDMRPVVVGFGPAGMFAALSLAKAGLRPIVLERGRDADSRKRDVDRFFLGGPLDVRSNVQFGEGGAGTFSDGKLATGIKDPRIRTVLKTFAEHGAGERILWDAKPHIGTDVLIKIVKSIRAEVIRLGGEVRFENTLTKLVARDDELREILVDSPEGEYTLPCKSLILAPGHSARDSFSMLKDLGIPMEPKPFAIGARIEHLQSMVDRSQYGDFASHPALGAADYRLSCHLESGRGVFTFCMCPGGVVVNAASEEGGAVTNGMSYSARDGVNANAALLVGVNVEDYYQGDPLDGVEFQRRYEQAAFRAGGGFPVTQRVEDFLKGVPSTHIGAVTPSIMPRSTLGSIRDTLPDFVTDAMAEGILILDRRLRGFAHPDALLTSPETRSSSPVRILRDSEGMSRIKGLYPAGEGAGYAGGITSAAVDGLKAAEALIRNI